MNLFSIVLVRAAGGQHTHKHAGNSCFWPIKLVSKRCLCRGLSDKKEITKTQRYCQLF